MKKQLMTVGLIASTFGFLVDRPGHAEIVSVTTSGSGGTVTNLSIDTLVNLNDAVRFDADYTALTGINVNVTVDGPGIYYVGYVDVTDDTTTTFPSFYAYLYSAPTGSVLGAASWSAATFGNGATFSPSDVPTSVAFNGPPGLAIGDSTSLYVGIYIPPADTGTQTFTVILTPTAVPEPSTFVLGLISTLAGLRYGVRRHRSKV